MKYILLIFICLFGMTACTEDNTAVVEEGTPNYKLANLLFTRSTVDLTNPDALVKDFTILVFDANSKELKFVKQTALDQNAESSLKMSSGFYDFYFIANIAFQNIKWSSIREVNDLLDLKLKAILGNSDMAKYGVPMIDIVEDVHVMPAGTEADRTYFKNLTGGRDIELKRAMSKFDIKLVGSGFLSTSARERHQVASIQLMNIAKDITPFRKGNKSISRVDLPLDMIYSDSNNGALECTVYVPNLNIATHHSWSSNSKQIPYLEIKLRTGEEFQVPLVANYNKKWGVGYMDFAVGAKLGPNNVRPIYSIYANTNYQYQFRLDNNQLDIDVSITPWIKEELVNEDYMKPKYQGSTIYLSDKEQLIENKIQIRKDELTPYFFMWLKSPESASWRLNLTNGLNFRFNDNISCGSANTDSNIGAHFLYVTSRIMPQNTTACTEVYFTINNEEVPMIVVFDDGSSKEFYGDNRLKIELVN